MSFMLTIRAESIGRTIGCNYLVLNSLVCMVMLDEGALQAREVAGKGTVTPGCPVSSPGPQLQ